MPEKHSPKNQLPKEVIEHQLGFSLARVHDVTAIINEFISVYLRDKRPRHRERSGLNGSHPHTCHPAVAHGASEEMSKFIFPSFFHFVFVFVGFVMALVFWFALNRNFRVGGMHRTANSICRK